uniref:Arrestin domain containing 5 n=1 Tax=Otus sunia TaxID=257818 RepID=A0A8C8ARJ8_9STRI
MSTVREINLVLPEIVVYLASSSIDGQLILNLRSTLVNPVVKVEIWEEAVYVSKDQTFHIEDIWLDSGVHTFDFHFSFPPSIPFTFTSKIGCISYFVQGTCCSPQIVLAKEMFTVARNCLSGVEARKDVVYFRCFSHGSVILQISLEKGIFCPGETIVLMTDIANRTCKYIRKVVFDVHCIVLYRGFSSRGEQHYLEDQSEVTKLEFQTDTAPFEAMRVTGVLVLPKSMSVTSTLMENKIMAFRYELVGTSDLSCTTSTIMGRVPIIIAATSEHFSRGYFSGPKDGCAPVHGKTAPCRAHPQ